MGNEAEIMAEGQARRGTAVCKCLERRRTLNSSRQGGSVTACKVKIDTRTELAPSSKNMRMLIDDTSTAVVDINDDG
jgi:hypothetical protein